MDFVSTVCLFWHKSHKKSDLNSDAMYKLRHVTVMVIKKNLSFET